MTDIRIYHNSINDTIVLDPSSIGLRDVGELYAIGNGDGTMNILNINSNIMEWMNLDITKVQDYTGTQVSTVESEVVDYVNGQFTKTSGRNIPQIFMPTLYNIHVGDYVHLENFTTNFPHQFRDDNLSTIPNLKVDPKTGAISGTVDVVPEQFGGTLYAKNDIGTGSIFILFNVFKAGDFVSGKSTIFIDEFKQYVSTGNNGVPLSLRFTPSTPWSLSAWIRTDNTGSLQCIFSSCTLDHKGWSIKINEQNAFLVEVSDVDGNITRFKTTDNAIPVNTWQHFVLTYNGLGLSMINFQLYINGIAQALGSVRTAFASAFPDLSTSASFRFGKSPLFTTTDGFAGNIDESSIWNIALDMTQVNEIYNTAVPTDLTLHSAAANLVSWWRMGDEDLFPIITDRTTSGNDLTMYNMVSTNFTYDVIPTNVIPTA